MRYIVQQSEMIPNGWVCTDTKNGIVLSWEEGLFNETLKITFLEEVAPDASLIARLMREAGEYLAANHSDKLFEKKKHLRKTLCRAIKEERERQGIPQVEIASVMGMHQSNYARFESGRFSPHIDTFSKALDYLGLEVIIRKKISNR